MKKFMENKIYSGKFITNQDIKFSFLILKRTEKTITIQDCCTKEISTRRIKIDNQVEYVLPFGQYSMSPFLFAK